MANDILTSDASEALAFESYPAVRAANQPVVIRFSVESLLGIVVTVLLLFGLGSGVYKKIRHDEAADAYRKGERDLAKRDLNVALSDYTAAIEAHQRYYDAYCRRAEVYAELGDVTKAEDDVKHAIAIHPLWPFALDLHRQFGHVKGAQGKVVWTPVSDSFELKPVIH